MARNPSIYYIKSRFKNKGYDTFVENTFVECTFVEGTLVEWNIGRTEHWSNGTYKSNGIV